MSRVTRSRSRALPSPASNSTSETRDARNLQQTLHLRTASQPIRYLDEQAFTSELRHLPKPDAGLLLLKRDRLRNLSQSTSDINLLNDFSTAPNSKVLAQAIAATLVFAGESAGTAVCIAPQGLLLTCAHCIAESADELRQQRNSERWLLFASGTAVRARTAAWDPRRDLALLQITAAVRAQNASATTADEGFPSAAVAQRLPRTGTRLVCIGHPGSEDLEAGRPGVATGYDVLNASEGRFRGMAPGQDAEDNAEIGALMHDCWTYWGHSGAPLLERATGELVGLHSSWDDETGMRRGVGLRAIRAFLAEHAVAAAGVS